MNGNSPDRAATASAGVAYPNRPARNACHCACSGLVVCVGSLNSDIYLAGPLSVAAAAVAGKIVDPREVFDEL